MRSVGRGCCDVRNKQVGVSSRGFFSSPSFGDALSSRSLRQSRRRRHLRASLAGISCFRFRDERSECRLRRNLLRGGGDQPSLFRGRFLPVDLPFRVFLFAQKPFSFRSWRSGHFATFWGNHQVCVWRVHFKDLRKGTEQTFCQSLTMCYCNSLRQPKCPEHTQTCPVYSKQEVGAFGGGGPPFAITHCCVHSQAHTKLSKKTLEPLVKKAHR